MDTPQETDSPELPWDTEIDTPATIAIIGAGPYAIEAALYARFLGYSVEIFSRRRVATSLIPWSKILMPGTTKEVTTTLGRAALEAQEKPCKLQLDASVTYGEYLERYLLPLAKTDLVYDSIHVQSQVMSVSKFESNATAATLQQRAEQEFRVSVQSQKRGWHSQLFDIVLDASGRAFQPGMGPGGGLACPIENEIALRDPPSKLANEGNTSEYAGKHTVLVGTTVEACLVATQIHEISIAHPNTRLTWLLPGKTADNGIAPPSDLPAPMQTTVKAANDLIQLGELPIVALPAWGIENAIRNEAGGLTLQVRTSAEETVTVQCDHLMHFGRRSAGDTFTNQLNAQPLNNLLTSEPHYYLLGSKAQRCQPWSTTMFEEIRQLFGLIGGRADLNLYATVSPNDS